MLGSPVTRATRSRDGFSHQSISPLRNAASAENGSKVSHSTRSKCATFGPAVKPTLPLSRGLYSANLANTARAPLTCSSFKNRKGPLPMISETGLNGDSCDRRSGMITGALPPGPARASGRCGNRRFRRKRTVLSSAADKSSVASKSAAAKMTRGAKRRMLATTSFASTGSPSWKRRPSRKVRFHTNPSFSTLWPATICGCACHSVSRP